MSTPQKRAQTRAQPDANTPQKKAQTRADNRAPRLEPSPSREKVRKVKARGKDAAEAVKAAPTPEA